MTQILYNLRTSDDQWRITKFTDGEVESSYLTSDQACDCPAGHRATCRHRAMLPILLPIVDTEWFWDYMQSRMVNLMGTPRPVCAPAEQDTERQTFTIPDGSEAERDADGRATGKVVPAGPHVEDSFLTKWTRVIKAPLTGQHTAAESLLPEQTVQKDILADLPPNHSARSGDVIGRMSFAEPKPWRRL